VILSQAELKALWKATMKLFGREFLLQLKSSLQCGRRLCEKRPHQHFHMRDSTRRARFGALVVISLHEPDSLKA